MDLVELKTKKFWTAVLAEFEATLLFVLITTGSAMSLNNSSYLHISLTFALAIVTMVQAIGHISGGHINPAVTIALLAARKITVFRALFYVVAQCVGAICGSALLLGITPEDIRGNLAANQLQTGVTVGAGFAVEFLITWQFVLTVFASTDKNREDLVGSPALAIGLSIGIGHLFGIGYTNCGMNPARSLGPAVISGYWDNHWIFWVAPILGGVLAGLQYEFLLAPTASVDRFKTFITCESNQGIIPCCGPQNMVKPVKSEDATSNGGA